MISASVTDCCELSDRNMLAPTFSIKIFLISILISFPLSKIDAATNDEKTSQYKCTAWNKCSSDRTKKFVESDHDYHLSVGKSSPKLSYRDNQCTPRVVLERCNSKFEDDPKWIWRRTRKYDIRGIATQKCPPSTLNYTWTYADKETGKVLGHFPGFKNEPRFVLYYYVLNPGNYTLKLTVTETAKGKPVGEASAECWIRLRHEDPIPIIIGGSQRTVPSGKAFTMEGSGSINMDVEPGTKALLYYKWSCVEGPQPFCSGSVLGTANNITMPSSKATNGTVFVFHLEVSTIYSKWISTKQVVKVKKDARKVYISCLKNCGPRINHRLVLFLQAKCDDCFTSNYEWSMTPGRDNKKKDINFESETAYGRNNAKLVVKEKVLQPGDSYTFSVTYDGGNSEALEEIKMTPLPEKGSCEVKPTEGKSLTTVFSINCHGFKHTDPLTYRIFQLDSERGGQGVLLDANEDGQFTLYLSAEKTASVKLLARVGDADGFYVENKLTVSVLSSISDVPADKQVKKLLDEYTGKDSKHESVNSLIARGETERAIQMMNLLTAEVRHVSDKSEGFWPFKKKLKALITEDLQKLPWETQDALRQVAATIKNLNWADKEKIDRDFAKAATKLCSKIAKKQIDNVMQSPTTETMSGDVAELSQDLLWCADTNMKPNLTDLKHEDIVFSTSTAHPLLTFPFISENYPNYDDCDLEYAQKMKDYQEITANAMDTIILTGMGIAKTQAIGEPVKQVDNYTNIVQIAADEAQLLPGKSLGGLGSFVKGSKSLGNWKTNPAHAVVAAYDENPFWWAADTKNFSTRVLDVNYFLNGREVRNLRKPMQLSFDVNETELVLINASVSVPKDLDKWTPERLNRDMTVHRVDVNKGAALRTEFFGLAGNDKIQVVVTYNRRPSFEDFKTAKFLWPGRTLIMSRFPSKKLKFGDAWFYIAVLPDKSMIKKSETDTFIYNYNVSFVSPLCVYWDTVLKKWSSDGCWTGKKTTLTKLYCFCIHHTTYSGVYLNSPNKIDKMINMSLVLSLHWNYMIFVCVCVVFGIYCVALIFAANNESSENPTKKIFFLGDNIEYERYAYLVIVRTGSMYSAGTTSNVAIKVFGKKCDSRAHVINYPDPDKKLLQRGNEDRFVLTTEKHLGDIRYIYIWHDSIGFRPSWYCKWISVFDLQESKEWFFDVQKWFSVLKEELRHFSIEPSTTKPVPSWRQNWSRKLLVSIKQEHSWNICKFSEENDLSYLQRITIILSIILTTYSFALMMYGTPGMRLYDGFGYGHYRIYPMTVLVAFLSSLLSFCLHFVFTMSFTKSLYNSKGDLGSSKKKCLFFAPHLVWVLLCLIIVSSLTFLIVFGFWVAYVTSLLWISSTVGALLQTILLLENIHIFIKITIWKTKSIITTSTTLDTSKVIKETERQRNRFFAKFGYSLLRPYFTQKYRPLTKEEWKIKREQELTRLKIAELLQDVTMFFIYIVVLYVVVLANKDSLNIYSHNEMKSLIHGEHTRTMNFDEIKTADGFYEYINQTLIPNIHSSNWYGRWEMIEPALMADFNIKIVGLARIRQLRVCSNCCKIPSQVKALHANCSPEISHWYSDVGEYMEYWKRKTYAAIPRLIGVWKYKYDAMPSLGELTVYPGGGYNAPLGRNLYNSYYNLKYYQETQWIDELSRVLHVEFLAYNANYNIFHAVKLLVERSASGLFIKTHSICTTRLLFVNLEIETMIFVSFAVFVVIIFLMFFKSLYLATKNWRAFFKEPWNVVDIFIVLMSFTCIGLYVHRIYLVGDLLHQLEVRRHNVFVSYFDLIYMEEVLTLLAAVLICVATIRLWKLLRFGVIFKIMERTLILSARPLTAVAVCHLIIILTYSFSGYVLFGAQSKDFKHLTATLTTLILLSLNLHQHFDYEFLEETHGGLGYIYYTLYMLISMTMFTLYIAAIVLSYTESGNYFSNLKAYYSVQKYVRDESRYYQELTRQRMKFQRLAGGADDEIPKKATPKNDEHRYANSVVVPTYKIFVMSLIARCVVFNFLRDKKQKPMLSSYQEDLMKRTVFHLLGKQDVPEPNSIAFTSFNKGNRVKLVSNNRILKMEYVVNFILDEGTAKNSKIEMFEEDVGEPKIVGQSRSEQLEYFEDALKSILNVFNNISIIIPDDQIVGEKQSLL